jgi:hypothetical protein
MGDTLTKIGYLKLPEKQGKRKNYSSFCISISGISIMENRVKIKYIPWLGALNLSEGKTTRFS